MGLPTVTLYSLSTCSHCKAVKFLLEREEIEADIIDVDQLNGDTRKAVLETVRQFNRRLSFPTLVIGEDVVVGYKSDRIKKTLKKNELMQIHPPEKSP
jgi:glutaredoxin-like protein NrdH